MKTTKILFVKFSAEERNSIGEKLALANQKNGRLENEKKQSMSQFKAEIDSATAEIAELSQKLVRGGEDRTIDCEVLYHTPAEGKKTVKRLDTGETLDTADMTDTELQDLFINKLGAQTEDKEFVFRDKSRCRLVTDEQFKLMQTKGVFKLIIDGMTEKAMCDYEHANSDMQLLLVKSTFDKADKIYIYSLYEFREKKA